MIAGGKYLSSSARMYVHAHLHVYSCTSASTQSIIVRLIVVRAISDIFARRFTPANILATRIFLSNGARVVLHYRSV